ncbi:MAG TPA: hypothetical protein VF268_14145 [Gammaproteobacteria bacterium]
MKRKYLNVLAMLMLAACASNSTLDFRIKVIPMNNVDRVVAGKIALAWVLQNHYRYDGWKLEVQVYKQDYELICREYHIKEFGEFCNPDYNIAVIDAGKALSWYGVIEECEDEKCNYRFGPSDLGNVE